MRKLLSISSIVSRVKITDISCPLKPEGMIEKIKVTDETIVGSIREVMSTATRQGKGLMPAISEKNIQLDKDLEMEFDYSYGMIALWSIQKGYSSIILPGTNILKIVSEISEIGFSLSTVKDTVGKINVYKKGEMKFVVQNKSNGQFRFYISFQ